MRHNNFDALRLLGALLVLVSHQFAIEGNPEPRIAGYTLGTIGVAIFFGISGYLVTGSWQSDPNPYRFAAKRMLRIWPALVVVVCTLALTYGSAHFLLNLAFIHWDGKFLGGDHPELDGSLWTIPYEMGCYVAVMAVGLLWHRRPGVLLLCLGATLFLFIEAFPERITSLGSLFFVGALIRLRWGWLGALGAFYFPLLIVPVLAVLIGKRAWVRPMPDLSYGLYLWAWPVSHFGGIVWTLLVTTTLAALSWYFVEKPCLKFKPALGSSWRPAQSFNDVDQHGNLIATHCARPDDLVGAFDVSERARRSRI